MLVHASIHFTLALSALVCGLPYYTTTFHFRLSPAQILSLHLPVFQLLGWSVLSNSQLFAKVIGHYGQVKLPGLMPSFLSIFLHGTNVCVPVELPSFLLRMYSLPSSSVRSIPTFLPAFAHTFLPFSLAHAVYSIYFFLQPSLVTLFHS